MKKDFNALTLISLQFVACLAMSLCFFVLLWVSILARLVRKL